MLAGRNVPELLRLWGGFLVGGGGVLLRVTRTRTRVAPVRRIYLEDDVPLPEMLYNI